MLSQSADISNSTTTASNSILDLSTNLDIAIWIRFLQHLRLPQLFENLSDKRQQSKIDYSNVSLALWAFSTCAFRQGSKNALNTTIDNLKGKKRISMASFLKIEDLNLPHSSTVDDYLRHIGPEELNNILIEIFRWGHKSKLFYNHAASLLPENSHNLGCDGFWTHTYTQPHAVDECGNNSCPYCLPRKRHAETSQEVVYWMHVFVAFVVIFPGGLKIPLYVYPLKAKQVNTAQRDDDFKQECELVAAHAVLPMLKHLFPRLSFTFNGDSLYANEPFIKLCNDLCIDYLIVRKEKSLKLLGRHCDDLSKTELYQKAYTHKEAE